MNYALQVLFVLALMGLGFVARRRGMLSAEGTRDMARVLVGIIYPCLIFSSITRLHLPDLLAHWMMPVLTLCIAGTGFLLGWVALRLLKPSDPRRSGAFLFQSTINNYLFLPLPLVLLLWGEKGVALLLLGSFGFELTIWTLGIALLRRSDSSASAPRFIFSPPLVALIISIGWICVRDLFPPAALSPIWTRLGELLYFATHSVGQATIALSMLVSGSRISAMAFRSVFDPQVWLVALVRLVAVPVVFILLLQQLPLDPIVYGILSIVATMPAAIASLVFSERFGGDSDFIASSLLVTHVAAIVTVPLLLSWAL